MAEATRRLFFALWPEVLTRTRLQHAGAALHRHWGGRRMRGENLHATLVFLGDTPVAEMDRLLALGAAQSPPRCLMRLDLADCWPRSQVAVLRPTALDEHLLHLVDGLQRDLAEAGLRFDRRPWKPHVTLLRHARCGGDAVAVEPIDWCVDGFVLLASRPQPEGGGYEVLGRWQVGGETS